MRVVGAGMVQNDGTYDVATTTARVPGRQVVLIMDGQDTVVIEAATVPGDLELRAISAKQVEGRVVDEGGQPIAFLPIRLGYMLGRSYDYLPPLEATGASLGQSTSFARTTTSADGRFKLLSDIFSARAAVGNFNVPRFTSESAEWYIDDFSSSSNTDRSIELVARPAIRLTATVTDTSHNPIVRCVGRVHWVGHSSFITFEGRDGRLDLCWPRWWSAEEDGSVEVLLQASGFAPFRTHVDFGPARAMERIFTLRTEETERSNLVLRVEDWRGRPLDGPWWLRIVDPTDEGKTLQDLGFPSQRGAGEYALSVPVGLWRMVLKPNDGLALLAWSATIHTVSPTTEVRCRMPPHGTLVVQWPEEVAATELNVALQGAQGGAKWKIQLHQKEFRTATCVEGALKVTVGTVDGRLLTGVGSVRAGEETVIRVSN